MADQIDGRKEGALGARLAEEIRRESKPADSPVAEAYVRRLGGELVAAHAGEPLEVTLEVRRDLDGKEPLVLPGGYLFVPLQLFTSVRDEQEFVGILAHAIAHVAARRVVRVEGSIPLLFIGPPQCHVDCRGAVLVPTGLFEEQRAAELAADETGVALAARAGVHVASFIDYVDRVQPPDSNMRPLPTREVRLARLKEHVPAATRRVSSSSAEFLRAREAARQILSPRTAHRPPALRRQ